MTREETMGLARAMHALREGRATPDAFLRETGETWRRLGRRIYSRWRRKLPAWVEADDVVQELRLRVLRTVPAWAPGKAGITSFVLFSAIHRTQRVLHGWRGASTSGNEGRNPSRAEIAFSVAFSPRGGEEDRDPADRATVQATQESAVAAAEAFDAALLGCATVREALVLHALREFDGSVEDAATALFEDFAARVECELLDEEHARRVVGESVSRIAARFEVAA